MRKELHFSPTELQKNLASFQKDLLLTWEDMPDYIVSSAEKKIGKEDILDYIEENIVIYNKHLQQQPKGS